MADTASERTLGLSVLPADGSWRSVRLHEVTPLPSDLRDAFEEAYFACPLAYGGQYDRANPPRKLASYLREAQGAKSGGALLDVGCAFGRFLEVAEPYYACEGLDVSRYALERARRGLRHVPLYHAAIEEYATDRRYDIVTCFDVLEHVPQVDLALRRVRDLLAPGGVLLAAIPVYDSFMGWAVGRVDRDPTHLHRWSRRAWVERLEAAGLAVRTMKGILRVPIPGYFLHRISERWRAWSAAILVVCGAADPRRSA